MLFDGIFTPVQIHLYFVLLDDLFIITLRSLKFPLLQGIYTSFTQGLKVFLYDTLKHMCQGKVKFGESHLLRFLASDEICASMVCYDYEVNLSCVSV